MENKRNISLDWLRLTACILVILQHVAEFFYVSADLTPNYCDNAVLVGIFNSVSRASVPLFIMISGYLLLPMRQSASDFFRRRFTRILFPFIIWSIIYSIYFAVKSDSSIGEWLANVSHIPFTYQAEHLWYVYMLIGLYLLVPILSPWIRSTSRKELEAYILLWGLTTFLPYLRLWIPGIWVETYFNPNPMFYYFTGFIGYMLLGHYLRRYRPFSKWLAIPAIVIGWCVTSLVFLYRLRYSETLEHLELSWGFSTVNVALITLGIFILISGIKPSKFNFINRCVVSISTRSYGIYLCHVLWLWTFLQIFMPVFDNFLIVALCVVPCTFISAYATIYLLSKLPKSKYIY